MYCLSDKQIEYIFNDISARGVEMESLQQNLLDHVCCIIEQNLEENGDFESFYQRTIKTFYKNELWEIEEETLSLLLFKNYYTMKKIMIISGAFSTFTMIMGTWFKFMHWPGASLLLPLGILSGSLVFLPLLFTLKMKEKEQSKDKFLLAIGAVSAILVSMSFLFRVMRWPGAMGMMYLSAIMMLLGFLPLFYFTGIRNPATRLNTITTSVLIIMAYGLLLMLVNTRPQIQENANLHANRYFQQSYETISERSNFIYAALKGNSEDKEKLAVLNARCNHLCDKIERLKIDIVNQTENLQLKTIRYENLGRLDNYDTPTTILFSEDKAAKPALKNLKLEMDTLNAFVYKEFNRTSPELIIKDWETANFYQTPLNYILRNFTQAQLNIRFIELSCFAGSTSLRASK